MKKIIIIILVCLWILLGLTILHAQEMRAKSNNVYLKLNQPRSRTSVPVISWVSPRQEYTHSTEIQIKVEAEIRSDVPLQEVRLLIGDYTSGSLMGSKNLEIPFNTTKYNLSNTIILPEASNYIEIIAENTNGAKASTSRMVLVGDEANADAVAIDRKDYALLFATDQYDSWSDLVNPIHDANIIASELAERFNFEIQVIKNADQEEIIEKIKEYSSLKFKPQDQLFIFFAGHGHFDEVLGEGYLVARNSIEHDKSNTTYISHSNLRTYINNIPCDHILLAMDVCFGGTFDPKIARQRGETLAEKFPMSQFLVRKLSKKTRLYITAGGKEYVSDGIVGKHSPFASHFIEALKSNGGEDRILTISELATFLEKVEQNEPRLGDFGDNEKGSDFVFVIK